MALSMPAPRGHFPSRSHDISRMPPSPCKPRTRRISNRRLGTGLPSGGPTLLSTLTPLGPPLFSRRPRKSNPAPDTRPLSPNSPNTPYLSEWDLEPEDDRAARRRTISLPTHGRKANPALARDVPKAKWRPWGCIDAGSYPHILDGIIANADFRLLLALRGVSRGWCARVDTILFEHVALVTPAASPRQVDRSVHSKVRVALRKRKSSEAVLMSARPPLRLLPALPGQVPKHVSAIRILDTYDYTPTQAILFDAMANAEEDYATRPRWDALVQAGHGLSISRSASLLNGSFPVPAPTVHAPTAVHYLPAVGLTRATIGVDVGTSRVILHFVPVFISPFAAECDTWLIESTGPCDVVFVFDRRAFAGAPNVQDLRYNLAAGLAESFELLEIVGVPLPNVTLVGLDELMAERQFPHSEGDVAFVQRFVAERVNDGAAAYVSGMTMAEWEARPGSEAALERAALPYAPGPFDED
ncbi:uncharacterized protein CcaverHIS019_0209020 [Cutaneotrichosporon cavernicola]|uniref:F-box domain-containing protein n=1 Tax=Cutaneotrichosporon cavernicola TaxID=279322 RepID=A0AA48L1F3_9TREE|nr:uncharacterized protein CcaverHIS019_0209020 [Cutaneotrichosporon cavernicola]BEI89540.1 hypothetical protein CcaverHIS019_0209020 [Cutaneotrichosporon cavernicola]BEI97313.1 hypothetical protein CcaverHIS631_0209020 [Cutaneotrichosporon cavernicola]BEJ05087.1 hypothetical protein CcaverHIS641_0209040 [Cutaneotrichosporon cavernicola]